MIMEKRDPGADLRQSLTEWGRFLDREDLVTLDGEGRQAALTQVERLLGKLKDIEGGTLLTGLLGGTGVGKSSLLNALAGTAIASTSHRRPHTEDVLVYRYEGTALPPSLPLQDVPSREYVHGAAAIGQIILCDLPDFDSIREEHRDRVIRFLEHLDVLYWVTSPEKYGDGRFYEFLGEAPRSRENFYFVLNKGDLFFQSPDAAGGYGEMGKVLDRFRTHLQARGISDPVIYVVSAEEILKNGDVSSWNRFGEFRKQLFNERSLKEVREIKAANLHAETASIRELLDRERAALKRLDRQLGTFLEELPSKRESWRREFGTALSAILDRREWKALLRDRLPASAILAGPGYGIAAAAEAWTASRKGGESPGGDLNPAFIRDVGAVFESHGHRVQREWKAVALRENPASWDGGFLRGRETALSGEERIRETLLSALERIRPPGAFFFRLLQHVLYGFFFLCFFAALSGEEIRTLSAQSPVTEWFKVLGSVITAFFSPRGLAALVSLVAVSVLLGWRFYIRARKVIYRLSDSWNHRIGDELVSLWEKGIDGSVGELKACRQGLAERIKRLCGDVLK